MIIIHILYMKEMRQRDVINHVLDCTIVSK